MTIILHIGHSEFQIDSTKHQLKIEENHIMIDGEPFLTVTYHSISFEESNHQLHLTFDVDNK